MKIPLEMVEVDGSVFISGTNLGPKIDRTHKGGCELYYDTEERMTYIVHKGKTWMGQVKGMVLVSNAPKISPPAQAPVNTGEVIRAQATGPEKTIRTAQVSTPMDKVQGVPGRKAKYQGEVAE